MSSISVLAPQKRTFWDQLRNWVSPPPPSPTPDYRELWRQVGPIYRDFPFVPTMLTADELLMLYWLTRDCYSGQGTVVDCGSFLGGSASALSAGLRANPREVSRQGIIHVYDRFIYESYFQHWFASLNVSLKDGDSFLPVYQRLTAQYKEYLTLHPGDILQAKYDAGPIEILFLDVCKSWEINDWVTENLFPHLIPGRSLVVQQDYLHYFPHWLVLTMDYFRDYLVPVHRVEFGHSALFQLVKKIPHQMLKTNLLELPLEEKKQAFEREMERSTDWQRTEVLVGYYRMLLEAGDDVGARDLVRRIPDEAYEHPINKLGLPSIRPEHKAA